MTKPLKLTQKQENFCWKYIETGNAHKAYVFAYDVYSLDNKDEWVYVEASKLLNSPKIAKRLKEIQEKISSEKSVDLSQILLELEQARLTALSRKDVQGMVKATVSKARILGLDKLKEYAKQLNQLKKGTSK